MEIFAEWMLYIVIKNEKQIPEKSWESALMGVSTF